MKRLLLLYLLFEATIAFPQDTAWKTFVIDENMSAHLPVNSVVIDTTLRALDHPKGWILIYKAETEHSTLGITVTSSPEVSKGSKKKLYREIETGFRREAREHGYSSHFSDTILENISGRKIIIRSLGSELMPVVTIAYYFVIKNRLYGLVFTPTKPGSDDDIRRLLNGCHFTVNPADILPDKPEERYEGVSTKELLLSLSIVALIVGILIIKYSKIPRKNNP